MLRSMFSAVSGLRSHQTMMDVTGNNIANVNTTGYKASRTTFQETLNDAVRGGTEGEIEVQGGQNPIQIGLGTQISATDTIFTQGASQSTGRATDVAIQGDGFFVVDDGGTEAYTRVGAFAFDSAGNLVTPGGQIVQGFAPGDGPGDPMDAITVDAEQFSNITIGADGMVIGRSTVDGTLQDLAQIAMVRFLNVEGLERGRGGSLRPSPASGDPIIDIPGENGMGTLAAGVLEMSNVDLAQEFTNLIISQRGFQANARTITTSDELLQELVNLKR